MFNILKKRTKEPTANDIWLRKWCIEQVKGRFLNWGVDDAEDLFMYIKYGLGDSAKK